MPAARKASSSASIIRRHRTGINRAAPPRGGIGTRPHKTAAWTSTLTRLPCRKCARFSPTTVSFPLSFGGIDMNKERAAKLYKVVQELKPNIIMNNRLGGGYKGDTETPEQHIPLGGFKDGRDWETCMTMNDTWGYKSYDNKWKSTKSLLCNLIDIASKGGNYLLNVGPTAEGLIPQPSIDRLREIGAWMKTNGEAIYGTTTSPLKKPTWGRYTQKPGKLYLHVFDWPEDGKLVVTGLANKPRKAVLLDGGNPLEFVAGKNSVTLTLPEKALNKIATVIVLDVVSTP